MTVEDPVSQNETPQQVYDQMRAYVEAQPLGSAEYQALSDYIDLQELEDIFRSENKWLLAPRDEAHKVSMERQARATDFQIALLNHQISQCKSRLPGYGKAYMMIASFFESQLFSTALREAEAQFPGDYEKHTEFITNKYSDMYDDISDTVWRKRE